LGLSVDTKKGIKCLIAPLSLRISAGISRTGLEVIAETLCLKKEGLIGNSIKAYLESELRRMNTEINALCMK